MYRERKSSSEMQRVKSVFVWVFVLIAMATIAVGGVEQGRGQTGSEEIVESAGGISESAGGNESDLSASEGVSADGKLKFIAFEKDKRLQDGLRVLAALYKKNIVPSAKVDGQLTVSSLHDVTFEQAMDAILGHAFKYEAKGNVINVYTAEEYKSIKEDPERMIYDVFTLYYISAAEAKKLIMPVLSGNSKIEVSSAAVTTFPTGESITTVEGGGDTPATNDTIIVYDYPENMVEVRRLLRELDVRPRQVLIEATILSVTLTEDTQFGIDWSTMDDVVTGIPGLPAADGDITRGSDYFKFAGTSQVTKSGGFTLAFAHGNIAAFIRAVEEVTDITILANPKILAVNKQLGQVYIGTKLGYKSQTTQTQTSTTEQVGFLDTGTKLSFRPYIGNDGYIRMDIHPKDSSGSLNVENVPDETSAELVTNIIVKDGQTIVIGGLFRDKVTAKKTQVPLLGDLPLLGALFRSTADKVERQEVMVLLTPHIIEEPGEVEGDERAEDVSRKRFGAKDELQSISRSKLAEDHYAKAARYYIEGDNESAMKALDYVLRIHPSYLEAIRLRERILEETNPNEAKKLERIVLGDIDEEEASMWMRR